MKPSQLTDEQLAQYLDWHLADEVEYEHLGPGKFQAANNPGLAERLWQASLEGWSDQETGETDGFGAWVAQIGRFLIETDSQGFVVYEEFSSEAEATKQFEEIDAEYGKWLDATDVPF